MKDLKDIVIITQARMNSERVKKKMLHTIGSTTLWNQACLKLRLLKGLGFNVLLGAGDDILVKIAKEEYSDIPLFIRSQKGCNVDVGLDKIYEWWDKTNYKYVVLFNPCLIYLKVETIAGFINAYQQSDAEGMFGVFKKKDYFWDRNKRLQTPWPPNCDILNTKAVEETYQAAHALYGSRMDIVGDGKWMGDFTIPNEIELFEMDEQECIDIDTPQDLELVQTLWKFGWSP